MIMMYAKRQPDGLIFMILPLTGGPNCLETAVASIYSRHSRARGFLTPNRCSVSR